MCGTNLYFFSVLFRVLPLERCVPDLPEDLPRPLPPLLEDRPPDLPVIVGIQTYDILANIQSISDLI